MKQSRNAKTNSESIHLIKFCEGNELWDRPSERVRVKIASMIGKEERQQTTKQMHQETFGQTNEMPKFHRSPPNNPTRFNTANRELHNEKIRGASERWNGSSQIIVSEFAATSAQQQSHQQPTQTNQRNKEPQNQKRICTRNRDEMDCAIIVRSLCDHCAIVSLTARPDPASQQN